MTGRAEPLKWAERVLVIKLGALGDMILALGPFAAIRKHHPAAFIALLTTAAYAEIGERCGLFDQVLVDSRPSWHDISRWLGFRRALRAGRFDRVYDLQSNDRTAAYRLLLWPESPCWIRDKADAGPRHAFDRHVAMLGRAGIDSVSPPDVSLIEAKVPRFSLQHPYALLVPGAAAHRPAKRWPAQRYGELASRLAAQSILPVILGASGDAATGLTITQDCSAAIDLVGQTSLFDIPALARKAVVAVGNDTGPMHLIAAAGCPSIVLFSSASDPARSAPRGPKVTVLRRESLTQLAVDDVAALVGAIATSSIAKADSEAAAPNPNNRP